MSMQDRSMELLISSYVVSSRRIQESLSGALSISNSREPTKPPRGIGEVIGLCGQFGRHPYFRIPLSVLTAALVQIDRLAASGKSPMAQVDELNGICQDLRQRTYFDAGTGCVNDELPAVVPLLPPEEIWCNGEQLPLDVWRLISFEFDLVSSAIASQVPVMDIGQGVATQGALLLGYILNRLGNKMIHFDARPDNLLSSVRRELDPTKPVQISAARLFFEAGSLLTPLAPTDFMRWYAGVRYLHWLDQQSAELRVRDVFKKPTVDSRYRGLFAEEVAIGLMAVVLNDRLGTVRINNTVEILPPTPQSSQPIADFIAESIDPSGLNRCIIAESKGSLGTTVNSSRRKHAKKQIRQTAVSLPATQSKLGLTFCSSLFFTGQPSTTHCLVNDPEPEGRDLVLDRVEAWRIAYAKILRFAGLDIAAWRVAHGEPAPNLGRAYEDEKKEWRSERERYLAWRRIACRERYGADLILDLGAYGLMVDSVALNVLHQGINKEGSEKLLKQLYMRKHERSSFERGTRSFITGLGIGCVLYEELG